MFDALSAARFRDLKPGMELSVSQRYRQPIAKVFAALTTPERIVDWMGVVWLGDPAPLTVGSSFSYRFSDSDMASEGRVLALSEPTVLEHSWFENIPPAAKIRWALEPDGEGCILTLTQSYPSNDDAPRNGAGWTMLMGGLEAWLDGRSFSPPESWRSLRDRFARDMGPAATRDGRRFEQDGRPVVQFTRLVDLPPEETWSWLTDPGKLTRWLGRVDIDPEVGGRFNVAFEIEDAWMSGTIVAIEAPRRLSMIWREPWFTNDDVMLDVNLERYEAGGTLLTLTHTFPARFDPHEYLPGWHEFLDTLEGAIHGGGPVDWSSPKRKQNWEKLKAVYKAVAGAGG